MTSIKPVIQCTSADTTVLSTSTCSTSNSTTHGSRTSDGYSVTWLHMMDIHSSASAALVISNIKVNTSGNSNCALERITFPRFTSFRCPTTLSSSPTGSTWLELRSLFTQTSNPSFFTSGQEQRLHSPLLKPKALRCIGPPLLNSRHVRQSVSSVHER